jgi:hypothetical protein
MTETDDLIARLAAEATPVKRLPPPLARTAAWAICGSATIAALAWTLGVRADWLQQIQTLDFQCGLTGSLATGVLGAFAAFMLSIPDRSRLWLLLPLPAACLWVGAIGLGCLGHWVPVGGAAMQWPEILRCLSTALLASVPLSALMFWMLRYTARLRPPGTLAAAGLSVGALTATAMSVVHRFDASLLVLVWTVGAAALIMAIDAAVGHRICRRFNRPGPPPARA